ncbi:class III lanthionine synthetase LanKC [Nocardia barduliensis]|uniref:class III lanthionine synthetase LanKC n=1 Tax=Nocardia barduliensis TaxID=2736643 RepID=UPI00157168DF|nr:class III lanthionine synthetase LanKC [Nocardia barduliensis]
MILEQYCMQDREFFSAPSDVGVDDADRVFAGDIPGYTSQTGRYWTYWTPDVGPDAPHQGWKIHLSATLGTERKVAEIAADLCRDMGLHFKVATSIAQYRATNSKNADRVSSGKLVTVYPDSDRFERAVIELGNRTADFDGPHILTDLRWKRGPVFVRYGGFRRLEVDGKLCIIDPHGRPEEDQRLPWFSPPPWVEIPEFLRGVMDRPQGGPVPFTIESAISHSNAGGVYLATILENGEKVVVKEGRPNAGYTPDGRDGYRRTRDEVTTIRRLGDPDLFPRVLWSGEVGGHYFMAMSRAVGITLQSWIVGNMPLYAADGADWDRYGKDCCVILDNAERGVNHLRKAGLAHADLHPRNIIVDPDTLAVTIIDFETAKDITGWQSSGIHAPGFAPPPGVAPQDIDSYALAQTITQMLTARVEHAEITSNRFNWALPGLLEILERHNGRVPDGVAENVIKRDGIMAALSLPATLQQNPPPKNFLAALRDDLPAVLRAAHDRLNRLPVHAEALEDSLFGLAFGAAGHALALPDMFGASATQQVVAEAGRVTRSGLFDGLCGSIYALLVLNEAVAAEKLARDTNLLDRADGWRIFDGKAGIMLAALRMEHFPDVESVLVPDLAAQLADAAQRYCAGVPLLPSPESKVMTNRFTAQTSGLMYGHLGLAWLFAEAHRRFGDDLFIDAMNHALLTELDHYERDDRNILHYKQGKRLIPYLATGSAGFGVALNNVDVKRLDGKVTSCLEDLARVDSALFTVNCSLFNGYAGLLYGTNGLKMVMGLPVRPVSDLNRMVRSMAVRMSSDTWAIPGDSNFRITTDLASGSSGVLHVESMMKRRDYGLLPPIPEPTQGLGSRTA